ncbi:hypothetical protein DI272_31410 [Streptomyces sp. Act143]|uniref:hypothetical protein n=1 Tax=Streptomyces sp. Act143 TaxID=2200760 RepID=UPI000D67908C|nr:hypothetical protein [Streptomyces sp. Act143]PWI18152.1 hypothetical protein DI272_31410 [Streptomyces sp. Act143]
MALLSLLFVLVTAVLAIALAGYGFGRLADRGVRRSDPRSDLHSDRRSDLPTLLRGLGALSGAVAAALCAWGLLIVVGALMTAQDGGTDSAPPQSCRTAGWWERHQRGVEIVGYSVSYLPLGFVCETSDGGSYDNGDVPWYVNAGVAGFGLGGVACAIGSGYVSELRARRGAAGGLPPRAEGRS